MPLKTKGGEPNLTKIATREAVCGAVKGEYFPAGD